METYDLAEAAQRTGVSVPELSRLVELTAGAGVTFREVGPVELRGVSGAVRLHAASRPG